ncbi:MAG: hypothetical protein ACXWPS_01915 [Ktedonobacteraceae bacterium]
MASNITCLVTLHGIGFEQPPQVVKGVELVANTGYADPLHQHLYKYLGTMLSDDPNREKDRKQPGDNGPIYVQSSFRDKQRKIISREEGLKRLGAWSDNKQSINIEDAPLVAQNANDGTIAHVALVYSNLEPMKSEVGATILSLESSLASSSHYGNIMRLLHMAVTDGLAMIGRHATQDPQPVSSRPRTDLPTRSNKHVGLHGQAAPAQPAGVLAALRNLEDDVACYVCHNEERERVRSFVFESLMRLGCRSDVENILLNTHSNGTVVAFDVLRNLPQEVTNKIRTFVTAGSPLRKYIDLFHWGRKIESSYLFEPWYNFLDRSDPVADPLNPPKTWRVGDTIVPSDETLFCHLDLNYEEPCWINVKDILVDNLENSYGGGLQAHNYWDNEKDFVKQLATLLQDIAAGRMNKAA